MQVQTRDSKLSAWHGPLPPSGRADSGGEIYHLVRHQPTGFVLMGAPIGTDEFVRHHISVVRDSLGKFRAATG